MSEYWYTVLSEEINSDVSVVATIVVKSESLWFSGHFPEDPILPGVAQLSIITDFIKKINVDDKKIYRLKRVKFKKIIKPEEIINFEIFRKKHKTYSYKILVDNNVIGNGDLVFR